MAIVELSHKELTTLNFCLATTEATGEIQNVPSLVEKVKPLKAKITAVIDNNYNDREDANENNNSGG